MFIYVDESGSFVQAPSENSWNVVAAYVVAEPSRRHAEAALRELKVAAGYKFSNEVKLKNVTEDQLGTFLDKLSGLKAVAFASCIDLGTQDPQAICTHQTSQVEKIRANGPRMNYEEGRSMIEDLANRVEKLSPQLYIQMVVQVDLLDQVHRASTLYFSQRVPATLGSFRWRIDEKNSSRPIFEQTLRHIAPPLLQTKSLNEPAIFVRGFDYSHYDRAFQFAPGEMPTYLQEATGAEIDSGSNLGKVLKDFEFVRSHDVPGVQIADLLASTFRRVLRGDFSNPQGIARKLGRLTLQGAKPDPSIKLITMSDEHNYKNGPAHIVNVIDRSARAMLL
ncbi:DUF3800 domain-containing protein [Comamonas jiangduensis]|uniref:DUF3800 domain-containing protein n=1 Tax=Comamonas jiangduensis TaxID=1194168 RepID=UPI003BF8A1A9